MKISRISRNHEIHKNFLHGNNPFFPATGGRGTFFKISRLLLHRFGQSMAYFKAENLSFLQMCKILMLRKFPVLQYVILSRIPPPALVINNEHTLGIFKEFFTYLIYEKCIFRGQILIFCWKRPFWKKIFLKIWPFVKAKWQQYSTSLDKPELKPGIA